MDYENMISVIGNIQTIRLKANSCDEYIISLDTSIEPVNIILSRDTCVIDSIQMYQGMRIAVFYSSTAPMPLIYPPQYNAVMVAVLQENENITLKYFDSTLTAVDHSLVLNVNPSTDITTKNGQIYTCNPGDNYLLVYYGPTTRSIPPQTSPDRIIVL